MCRTKAARISPRPFVLWQEDPFQVVLRVPQPQTRSKKRCVCVCVLDLLPKLPLPDPVAHASYNALIALNVCVQYILWDIENMPMDIAKANASLRKLDSLLEKAKFTGSGIKKIARFFFTTKSQHLVPQKLMKKLDEAGK